MLHLLEENSVFQPGFKSGHRKTKEWRDSHAFSILVRPGNIGRLSMEDRKRLCRCSILDAREEQLMDDEGVVQLRLVCNDCGAVLDAEKRRPKRVRNKRPAEQTAEAAR